MSSIHSIEEEKAKNAQKAQKWYTRILVIAAGVRKANRVCRAILVSVLLLVFVGIVLAVALTRKDTSTTRSNKSGSLAAAPNADGMSIDSSIAAVTWYTSDNETSLEYRVYFQNATGELTEAVQAAGMANWTSKLVADGDTQQESPSAPKIGTPLAASRRAPGNQTDASSGIAGNTLYYMDERDRLCAVRDNGNGTWAPTSLASLNLILNSTSQLAAGSFSDRTWIVGQLANSSLVVAALSSTTDRTLTILTASPVNNTPISIINDTISFFELDDGAQPGSTDNSIWTGMKWNAGSNAWERAPMSTSASGSTPFVSSPVTTVSISQRDITDPSSTQTSTTFFVPTNATEVRYFTPEGTSEAVALPMGMSRPNRRYTGLARGGLNVLLAKWVDDGRAGLEDWRYEHERTQDGQVGDAKWVMHQTLNYL